MCALYGYLTLGFSLAAIFSSQKHILLWCSIQMLDLSVKMMLSKVSEALIHLSLNAKWAAQLGSRMAWQYLLSKVSEALIHLSLNAKWAAQLGSRMAWQYFGPVHLHDNNHLLKATLCQQKPWKSC